MSTTARKALADSRYGGGSASAVPKSDYPEFLIIIQVSTAGHSRPHSQCRHDGWLYVRAFSLVLASMRTHLHNRYQRGPLVNVLQAALGWEGEDARRLLNLTETDPYWNKAKRFVKHLQVIQRKSNKTRTVSGLVERAGAYKFALHDGRMTTIQVCYRVQLCILSHC